MTNINTLIHEFIKGADQFYFDSNIENIDKKHTVIVKNAYDQFKNDINLRNFRNWTDQTDLSAPIQLSKEMLQCFGIFNTLMHFFYKKIFKRLEQRNLLSSMLDDIDAIKKIGGLNYLRENPVHKTPGTDKFYQLNNSTFNGRWLKYIYLTTRIIDDKMLSDGGIWVDIGSYYGGLQGLIKRYLPNSKIILVDFHHQLCRSYIYLKTLFPNAQHYLPNTLKKIMIFLL